MKCLYRRIDLSEQWKNQRCCFFCVLHNWQMAEFSIIQLVSWDAILANGVRVCGSFFASGPDFIGCSQKNIFINRPKNSTLERQLEFQQILLMSLTYFSWVPIVKPLLRSCRWSIVICMDLFFTESCRLRVVIWWLRIFSDHKEGLRSRRMFTPVVQLNTKIVDYHSDINAIHFYNKISFETLIVGYWNIISLEL